MALDFVDFFTGADAQTCSYTTDFISKHAKTARDLGMTEKDYQNGLVQGHWGVLKGKISGDELNPGTILFQGKTDTGGKVRASWSPAQGKIRLVYDNGDSLMVDPWNFDAYLKSPNYEWRVPTAPVSAVSNSSKSIGALTNEDAATMFVKTKDEFAKAKGINIKGANPMLDKEVFNAIAKATGYTPAEITQKVENYKSSGKKLSALKKKALKGKAETIMPSPVTKAVGDALPTDVKKVQAAQVKYNPAKYGDAEIASYNGYDVASMFKGEDWGSTYWSVSLKDKNGMSLGTPKWYTSKTEAQKSIRNHAEGFKNLEPKVQPSAIHVEATKPSVQAAVDDLLAADAKNTLLYSDEDIVKAYIQAKDQLAFENTNSFTLYTKSEDFDKAIYHLMSKEYGVDAIGDDIKAAIANYLGDGNKISVLKKKMTKSGEFTPKADTLKKTKAQKQFDSPATTSVKEAQAQIDVMASTAETPIGAAGVGLTDAQAQQVFDNLKNNLYASMSPSQAMLKFEEQAKKLKSLTGKDIHALDVMRAYDKLKSKQLGIDNGFFYEKKVVEWASSPAGKADILKVKSDAIKVANDKTAAEKANELINVGVPDLPADSVNYQTITTTHARAMQDKLDPWNADQKSGIRNYTTGQYTPMNQFLRGKTGYINETNRLASNTAQAGMRAQTEEFLVLRGCNYKQFDLSDSHSYSWDAIEHQKAKDMTGKTVQDKGFTSTSVGDSAAFGGPVRLEVEVAKGTYGAYVDHISANRGENEFLIARGTQYKVLRVTKDSYGKTVIRVRTIPGSHSKGTI